MTDTIVRTSSKPCPFRQYFNEVFFVYTKRHVTLISCSNEAVFSQTKTAFHPMTRPKNIVVKPGWLKKTNFTSLYAFFIFVAHTERCRWNYVSWLAYPGTQRTLVLFCYTLRAVCEHVLCHLQQSAIRVVISVFVRSQVLALLHEEQICITKQELSFDQRCGDLGSTAASENSETMSSLLKRHNSVAALLYLQRGESWSWFWEKKEEGASLSALNRILSESRWRC